MFQRDVYCWGNAKAVVVSTGKIRIQGFFILVVVERLNV